MTSVLVLNGPNLNLLGTRQPEVYGTATLADVERLCRTEAEQFGLEIEFRQSNHEGELIDWLHETAPRVQRGEVLGVIFNPGAFTHTSIALRDAIDATNVPVVEVHISNVYGREDFRHRSYISPVATGVIVGLGVRGYALAIRALAG